MNVLSLIKNQVERQNRLYEAQKMHLKAYRGVPYTDAPKETPLASELTYRGQAYHIDR